MKKFKQFIQPSSQTSPIEEGKAPNYLSKSVPPPEFLSSRKLASTRQTGSHASHSSAVPFVKKLVFTLAEAFSLLFTGQRKTAFTLAEVLITLGIIGIVAAMTLPALVQNHRRHVVETSLAKFYSSINQAIKISEAVNGDKQYWDELYWVTNEDGTQSGFNENNESISYLWYQKYLAPYLKTTKVELANSYDGMTKLYFADGSMLAFWSAAWYFFPKASDYAESLSEDGSSKFDKSKSGRKFFVFIFSNKKGVEPWGHELSDEELKTGTYNRCVINYTNEPAACATVIQRNGWKVPKDYPFKL